MEIASYLMAVVYVVSFLAMSAILAKEAGRPVWLFDKGREKQTLPARPTFNGADIALTFGVMLMLLAALPAMNQTPDRTMSGAS